MSASFDLVIGKDSLAHDGLMLDEDTFSLDSLALLDLVMEVTRYFNLQDSGVEDYLFVQRRFSDWVSLISHHFVRVGEDAKLTFQTSGSTGPAKKIDTSASRLFEEVSALPRALARHSIEAKRIVSAIAPQHIYGLIWSVLLPQHLGCSVIDRYKLSPRTTGTIAQAGDIILATPFLWKKFAEADTRFPTGCVGVSSGGPASQATYDAARETGLDRLVEVYGASETGGIGLREGIGNRFQLLPHLLQKRGMIVRKADRTSLNLQDRLVWENDGTFRVAGRVDTVVQVAGTNVNVSEVTTTIKELASVSDAAVRLDGQRLKAFVVLSGKQASDPEAEIRAALRKLPPAARPDRITFGQNLPRNEAGKLADWA